MSISNTQSGETGPVFYNSGVFYGIKFFNEVKDDLDFDRHVSCIPDVHLLNSNGNILVDYSPCANASQIDYIEEIINGISLGAGFTFENGKYIDPVTGIESDLSGTFTYSATFDKAIYGTVNTVTTVENLDKKYSNQGFFEDFDAIYAVQNNNNTEQNTIKNSFGSKVNPSFAGLGLKEGDYVKILNGTNSSQTLHQVTKFYRDFNDHEIVQFGNSADFSDENRIGSNTSLRLYRVPEAAASTSSGKILDATGNAIAVDGETITNLIGRVNIITPYILDKKFVNNGIRQPTFLFNLGSTYVFNITEASMVSGNHILRISSTPDGKWNGGSPHPDVYTTDSIVVFEPTESGTFYYYCENHPNMGGKIQITDLVPNQALQITPVFLDSQAQTSSGSAVNTTTTSLQRAQSGNSGIYG